MGSCCTVSKPCQPANDIMRLMSNIYFIIGVNGVGKSSVIPYLQASLSNTKYSIHDFDERGVPDNADKIWRQSEIEYWLEIGKQNSSNNIATIICGFAKPEELNIISGNLQIPISVILLDANAHSISERISGRYTTSESKKELERTTGKSPEKFIEDNVWVSTKFREGAQSFGYSTIDTSKLSPQEVANQLISLIEEGF